MSFSVMLGAQPFNIKWLAMIFVMSFGFCSAYARLSFNVAAPHSRLKKTSGVIFLAIFELIASASFMGFQLVAKAIIRPLAILAIRIAD